jgi:hypothetical protein
MDSPRPVIGRHGSSQPDSFEIARKIKPDVIPHPAARLSPSLTMQYDRPHRLHGIQVGSSIERLAIEKPLEQVRRRSRKCVSMKTARNA